MKMMRWLGGLITMVSVAFAGQQSSEGWQSVFSVDKSALASSGTNPYFVLLPGHRLVYETGKETVSTTVLNETKTVDGVETRVVEDRETRDGQLTEVTRDYFAIDPATRDVYYFGEDVDVYRAGKVVSHEGSWLSGVNGARFGLMMPGSPKVGMRFYQEQAPRVAMDRAEIVAVGDRVDTPAGVFDNCVHVVETSAVEKDATDHKWYAPGVGCVKDGDMPLVRTVSVRAQAAPEGAQEPALRIDLKNALERARVNSPQLQSAAIGVQIAREDRRLAKFGFYPNATYLNEYIYTQGNGTESGVFVANDGVHVYNSQAVVHQEVFAPGKLAEYRRTLAAEALASAKRDVALRGLVSSVIQDYYAIVTARRRLDNAGQSVDEARRFVDITRKLEAGGEVARADVIKAQLTLQQRQRDLLEAQLSIEKGKVGLAVLIFPDYRTDFAVVDDLDTTPALPPFEQVQSAAREASPDLRAAQATLRQEQFGIAVARSGYLPSFSLDYFFGIDNHEFSVRDAEGRNRLGSVAQATLNIPVFSWWNTRSKVRQAELRRQQAQLDLTVTQRELVSGLRTFYLEAQSALAQLDSLKRTVDFASESLRLTNLRYQAGEASVLEVVDAQTTLVQARNAYDEGLSRYRLAAGNLQTLMGIY